ncbi:hypothetical protein P4I94_34950, partial [Bacillus cereus]|nr:hypothetical protein [Bacillus cereus]
CFIKKGLNIISVDEHTQVAIKVVAQSLKISEHTLLRILQTLSKLLEGTKQQIKNVTTQLN